MGFCDSEARYCSALSTPPKAKWVCILGVVAGFLVFASPAASQEEPRLCLASPSCLAAGSPPALPVFQPQASQQSPGRISGTISSKEGNPIVGAEVTLTRGNQSAKQQALSDDDGNFSFANVGPGPFQLDIMAPPFESQTYSDVLAAGQNYFVPLIVMPLATVTTVVTVYPPDVEAAHEVKAQEQQRVLGFIPNFYVSYAPNPVPLNFKQKLDLAWKSSTDPITIGSVAAGAGIEQAKNWFSAYGQGAQGYGKRLGAAYGDVFIGTFLGSAVFPALLKQDPRYFYKGTGSSKSRIWYALTRSVITKGGNGRWQPNYSNFLGNLAASGIENAYRTPKDQRVGFAFQSAGIRVAETAFANVFQEFFSRKLTPILSHRDKTRDPEARESAKRAASPGDSLDRFAAGNSPN